MPPEIGRGAEEGLARKVRGPGHVIYREMLWVLGSFHVAPRRLRGSRSNCRLQLLEGELQRQWNQTVGSNRW